MFEWIWRVFRSRDKIGGAWCALMHHSPRWPIYGHYECGICGRRYRVPWFESEPSRAIRMRQPAQPTLSS